MFGWLRKRLRNWLLVDEEEKSVTLEVLMDGAVRQVSVQGAIGMKLNCFVPHRGGVYQRLIGEGQACDKHKFWKLWQRFGGKFVWEDGSRFEPPA